MDLVEMINKRSVIILIKSAIVLFTYQPLTDLVEMINKRPVIILIKSAIVLFTYQPLTLLQMKPGL
jgi:hypothetical protein